MRRKILLYTDARLRKKSVKVARVDVATKKLIKDMVETMRTDFGVGLSAPQVGVFKRIIAYEYIKPAGSLETCDSIPLRVLINPEITHFSKTTEVGEEGCLSFPNLYGDVRRSKKIKVMALDANGKPIEFEAKGLEARVIQHEIDHLDGILFVDRLGKDKRLYTYK
ncbi:peptide deformylase [Patescibacteria group bacterium]|nr:peptide deformylase [Patescibacteria group bacterium]